MSSAQQELITNICKQAPGLSPELAMAFMIIGLDESLSILDLAQHLKIPEARADRLAAELKSYDVDDAGDGLIRIEKRGSKLTDLRLFLTANGRRLSYQMRQLTK